MRQTPVSDLQAHFNAELISFQTQYSVSRWVVAFSGGLDSRVLLHLLVQSSSQLPIIALHVNHGLSDQALAWQVFCEEVCLEYCEEYRNALEPKSDGKPDVKPDGKPRVAFMAKSVTLASGSIEEKAREARYQALERVMKTGDAVMMGHHLNDQAETVLQRLFRGAGISGLEGIPAARAMAVGPLFRPLLAVPRSQLEMYASEQGLSWVEDESNLSEYFDRNFLRHTIVKPLIQRWPKALAGLQRTIQNLQQESTSLNYYRAAWLRAEDSEQTLNLAALFTLPEYEQLGMLSFWIKQHAHYSITRRQLEVLLNDVGKAKADAQAIFQVGERVFRRYQSRLYCLQSTPTVDSDWRASCVLRDGQSVSITLADGSCLVFEPLMGGVQFPDKHITVQYRQGGESLKPWGEAHTRELKKWLQQQGVPPWERPSIPLLYCNQALVAVADRWFDQRCLINENEMGWQVLWCSSVNESAPLNG